MADQKISELTNITGANLADADEFVVVDTSADQTKAVTRAEFFKNTPPIDVTGTVTASTYTGPNTDFRSVGSAYLTYGSTSDSLIVRTDNGAERMRVDASGNVGIGTASPSNGGVLGGKSLHISATGETAGVRVENTSATISGYLVTASGDNSHVLFGTGAKPLITYVNSAEAMRIDSSGNLLVANTAPLGSEKFNITFDGSADWGCVLENSNSGTSANSCIRFYRNGTNTGAITHTGTTTAYNTTSDYRLKENITPVQGAADIVKAMRPCTYTFKADSTDWHDGFLAHELQELHPRAVVGEKDAVDEEGNPEYQGVDYSKLTPILTAALQEALNKIDALETRLTALEG